MSARRRLRPGRKQRGGRRRSLEGEEEAVEAETEEK